jgi:hypothetical protein
LLPAGQTASKQAKVDATVLDIFLLWAGGVWQNTEAAQMTQAQQLLADHQVVFHPQAERVGSATAAFEAVVGADCPALQICHSEHPVVVTTEGKEHQPLAKQVVRFLCRSPDGSLHRLPRGSHQGGGKVGTFGRNFKSPGFAALRPDQMLQLTVNGIRPDKAVGKQRVGSWNQQRSGVTTEQRRTSKKYNDKQNPTPAQEKEIECEGENKGERVRERGQERERDNKRERE